MELSLASVACSSSKIIDLSTIEIDYVAAGSKAGKLADALALLEAAGDFIGGFIDGFGAGPG